MIKETERIKTELDTIPGLNCKVEFKEAKIPKIEVKILIDDERHIVHYSEGNGLKGVFVFDTLHRILEITNKNQTQDECGNYNFLVYISAKTISNDCFGDWSHWFTPLLTKKPSSLIKMYKRQENETNEVI